MSSKILILSALVAVTLAAPEVPVTIYYESLCPDSLKFFREQFSQVFLNSTLGQYIKPTYVPWGHANVSADGTINCQHGKAECDGNRLQACALNVIPQSNLNATASYITCLMSLNLTTNETAYPTNECKVAAGDYYDKIIGCYNNTDNSIKLLKEYGDKTTQAFGNKKFGVPYVVINNHADEDTSKSATDNLKDAICKSSKNLKLSECPDSGSASTMAATVLPVAIVFMLGRI